MYRYLPVPTYLWYLYLPWYWYPTVPIGTVPYLGAAPLDVAGLPDLHPVAPPPLEMLDPVPTRSTVVPPRMIETYLGTCLPIYYGTYPGTYGTVLYYYYTIIPYRYCIVW